METIYPDLIGGPFEYPKSIYRPVEPHHLQSGSDWSFKDGNRNSDYNLSRRIIFHPDTRQRFYKVVDREGQSASGGSHKWSLPSRTPSGVWTTGDFHQVNGHLELCERGFHLTTDPIGWWFRYARVFLAEGVNCWGGDEGDKFVFRKARLIEECRWPWWVYYAEHLSTWCLRTLHERLLLPVVPGAPVVFPESSFEIQLHCANTWNEGLTLADDAIGTEWHPLMDNIVIARDTFLGHRSWTADFPCHIANVSMERGISRVTNKVFWETAEYITDASPLFVKTKPDSRNAFYFFIRTLVGSDIQMYLASLALANLVPDWIRELFKLRLLAWSNGLLPYPSFGKKLIVVGSYNNTYA